MKTLILAASLAIGIASSATAFECPQHFAEAQAAIDKTSADMEGIAVAFMVPAILFLLFVAPVWLVLHYRSKRRQGAELSEAERKELDALGDSAERMAEMMDKGDMALVHALLDDAKMLLAGAQHNHEKPQGPYDHARAIAKADAALGYAQAADMLHFKYMAK